MMKRICLYVITLILPLSMFAQRPLEVGMMGGFISYNGDLGNFIQSGVGPAFGGFSRYSFNFPIALQANLAWGLAHSKDKVHPESQLYFRSSVLEYSFQVDVYITRPRSGYRNYSVKQGRKKYYVYNFPVTTYVFIGFGRFHYNPKAQFTDGSWHDLQPLSTEGQGVFPTRDEPYKLSSTVIPLGAGVKFPFKGAYSVGFELGFRKSYTDYFDDVSLAYVNTTVLGQAKGSLSAYFADPSGNPDLTTKTPAAARGNPKNKDAYMFAFVTLQYDFGKVKKKKSFRI